MRAFDHGNLDYATLLRWAELTAEISQGALKPSQVIDQLLRTPMAERDVSAARVLCEQLTDKVCVWTVEVTAIQRDVDRWDPGDSSGCPRR
jgi:hypothetical protein